MVQEIIVGVIVLVAAVWLVRRIFRRGGGCECPSAPTCPFARGGGCSAQSREACGDSRR